MSSKSDQNTFARQASQWWAAPESHKYTVLLKHAPSLILAIDKELKIRFVNRDNLFGKAYEIGDHVLDYAGKLYKEILGSNIDYVLKSGEEIEFQSHSATLSPDGTIYYTNQLAPIVEDDTIVGVILVTTTITEQVENRMEFEFVNERLKEAQQIAKVGSWELNMETGKIWWSDELYKMYGLERGDVDPTLKKFLDKIHKDDRGLVRKAVDDANAGINEHDVEFRIVASDQRQIYVHTIGQVSRDESGKAIAFRGIAQDITERKIVQQELLNSQARLAEAQRIAKIGNWEWDMATDKISWSQQVYRIFGAKPNSFVPDIKQYLDRVHPDDREMVLTKSNLAVKEKQSYTLTFRILSPDGEVRYLKDRVKVFMSKDGVLERIVGALQDITEQRKAEAQLAIANKLLINQTKREQRVKSRALIRGMEDERSRISRELHDGTGQMLSAIKFSVSRLSQSEALTDKDRQGIEDIKELIDLSIEETIGLSNNLMPSVLRDFGLKPAIQKIVKQFDNNKETKIIFNSEDVLKRLPREVETGLYRITQESVNNAMKYAEADVVEIDLSCDGSRIFLSITDDGKGFDIEEKSRNSSGLGNGLINIKERVVMLGGRLRMTSNIDNGTCVHVEVPLTENDES